MRGLVAIASLFGVIVGCSGTDAPFLPAENEVPAWDSELELVDEYGIDAIDASCCVFDVETMPLSEQSVRTLLLELESLAAGRNWITRRDEPGFSGDGFIMAPWNDHCLRLRVPLSPESRYTIWTRAFEGMLYDRSIDVKVDGSSIGRVHDDWRQNRFRWQRAGDVQIERNTTVIELCDVSGGLAMMDALVITSDARYDPERRASRFFVRSEEDARWAVRDRLLDRIAAERAEERGAPASPEEWSVRAGLLRPKVLRALGLDPLPERTPLAVELVGSAQRDGYRVERLIFESRPGFIVPALLLIPDGEGPFPAVLRPIGHWGSKSAYIPLTVSIGLVREGYVVLTYDPFGQGERAVYGNGHYEHYRLLMSGHTNLSFMVWDSIRALDLLLERPEVDGQVAITGASGGGLNAFYTAMIDDRLAASIPVVYVSEWEHFLATNHPHDNCSHVPGIASIASAGELAALFAPRPQAIFSAREDVAFTVAGAEAAAVHAKEIYRALGVEDLFQQVAFDGGHDYSQAMREALYGFLDLHLRGFGDGSPKTEEDFEIPREWDPDFQCFSSGTVSTSSTTVRDLSHAWADALTTALPEPDQIDRDEARARLLYLAGKPELGAPRVRIERQNFLDPEFEKWAIEDMNGHSVSALYFEANEDAPTFVVTDPGFHTERHPGQLLREKGINVLYVSPSGHGETAWAEHLTVTDQILAGEPILVRRALELTLARRALTEMKGVRAVGLLALHPDSALAGLFAQALFAEFDEALLGSVPGSLMESFAEPVPLQSFVPRILEMADMPHLIWLASERPLRIEVRRSTVQPWSDQWEAELAPFIGAVDEETVSRILTALTK